MKKILIIGAGITGLSTAYFLKKKSTILEIEKEPGGYCKTIKKDGFIWDYSGHYLHFKSSFVPKLMKVFFNRKELLKVKKKTKIFIKDKYIDYPYQQNFYKSSFRDLIVGSISYIFRSRKLKSSNLKNQLLKNYGKFICENFLFPYNEKLYRCNLKKLHPESFGRYLPKINFINIINSIIFKKSITSYNDSFIVPKKGIFELIKKFLYRVKNKHKILYNAKIRKIDVNKKMIYFQNKSKIKYDVLVNTSPLPVFLKLINKKNIKEYSTNTILTFNLGFKEKKIPNFHWTYFPERKYVFHRVGCYSKIYKNKYSSLFVEVSTNGKKKINNQMILDKILNQLEQIKIIQSKKNLISYSIIKMKPAYVHVRNKTESSINDLRTQLLKKNIFLVGRYALWKYSSIEDNILESRKISNQINDIYYNTDI